MSDEELRAQIDEIGVIARVTPEDKVRLVDTLKAKGHVVAMTGDGVNDAPALKRADIGVAMGITGTEVSKEAAAMILTDDDFSTIVKAVEIGRGLYDNLKKYIRFQMGCLTGFIVTFLGAEHLQRRRRRAVPAAPDAVRQLHDAGVPGDRARLRQAGRRPDGAEAAAAGGADPAAASAALADHRRRDHGPGDARPRSGGPTMRTTRSSRGRWA